MRQATHVRDALSAGVDTENLVAFAQKINNIATATASGIQNFHARREASFQNLIEEVNIYVAELFVYCVHKFCATLPNKQKLRGKIPGAIATFVPSQFFRHAPLAIR